MVRTFPRLFSRASISRLVIVLAAILLAALAGPGVAAAQENSGGGTYGFNGVCEQIHDDLDGVGIPDTPLNLGNAAGGVCKAGNALTHPGQAAEVIKDKAWDSTFGKAVNSLLTGLGQAISLALTFWAKVPNSATDDLPGLLTKVRGYTDTIQLFVLAASIMYCGVRLAAARAGAAAEEATEAFRVLFRTVLASGVWAGLIMIATRASDAFSVWVIDDATGGNAKGIAETMVATNALTAFSPGLIIVFALVGLLSALVQIVLAIVRQGLLVMVVGVLPVAAASSGARAGQQFYQRLLLWSIAFVLYKPVAAIAYMIAFTLGGSNAAAMTSAPAPDSATAVRALVAVALLCSVAFVLPAIMRLLSPVAGMGSGSSGAMLAGGIFAGGSTVMGMGGAKATGATSSHGGGTVTSTGGGNRPSGTATVSRSSSGGTAAGKGAAASGSAGAAKAAGPYGAAAAAAVQGVGAGMRAGQNTVNQAAASGSNAPPPRSQSRPSGVSNQAVPR